MLELDKADFSHLDMVIALLSKAEITALDIMPSIKKSVKSGSVESTKQFTTVSFTALEKLQK